DSDAIDKSKLPENAKGGLFVTDVAARSPGSVMGLRAGDIIIKVNDQNLKGIVWFYKTINDPANKKLSFTIVRDEQIIDTLAYNKN
ncbi:MAG TPA: hypothetical protein DCQ16_02140, partial [Spirochaetaceae bacterium]|nr:hypothetical protein [Spirochaetaceae bacterium]